MQSMCMATVVLNVEVMNYKRDREPSRVPENMLKRLSQKNKKLLSYVWSC